MKQKLIRATEFWRLFSLSSAGWDGRNDSASDSCDSDGVGDPVFLAECQFPQEGRDTGWRGFLSGTRRAAIRSTVRSPKLGISGKPDCLIQTADGIVPVELKKSKRPPARGEVYPNHMIQNLAYCALVEEQLRERVPYGLVIYPGSKFDK